MTGKISTDATAKAEKALSLPIGAASPLWFAYAGVTAGAVTWWWMNQWMKPMNLEAMKWPRIAPPLETPLADSKLAEPFIEAANADISPVMAALEPVSEAIEAVMDTTMQVVQTEPDDLTVLVGIGPTLATKLGDLGIKTYADIAAWTESDVETFDKQLKLLGRITRDGWINQARQLAEAAA